MQDPQKNGMFFLLNERTSKTLRAITYLFQTQKVAPFLSLQLHRDAPLQATSHSLRGSGQPYFFNCSSLSAENRYELSNDILQHKQGVFVTLTYYIQEVNVNNVDNPHRFAMLLFRFICTDVG